MAAMGASSLENMGDRISRVSEYEESMKRISNDHPIFQVAGGITASILDPVNFIPIAGTMGKARSFVNATSNLGRIAATAGVAGTVGALSNVASEAIMAEQGLPHDYESAALIGFALGGTLGGVIEGVSRTAYQGKLANALYKDDQATLKNTELKWSTTDPNTGDTPQLQGFNLLKPLPDSLKNFWNSDTTIAYMSDIPEIRNVASAMSNVVTGFKNGMISRFNMKDDLTQLDGKLNKRQIDLMTQHRDAVMDGTFKGSMDDWFNKTGKDYASLANKQEINVKSDDAYLDLQEMYTTKKKELDNTLTKFDEEYKAKSLELGEGKKVKDLVPEAKKLDAQHKLDMEAKAKEVEEAKMKLEEEYLTKLDELYAKHLPPKLNKSVQTIRDYYSDMLDRGKYEKIPELMKVPKNRLYFTRQWE
jgi:hypothetical protein